MYQTKIIGTGMYVPPKVMTNNDMTKLVDTSNEWIIERTGIEERRICDPEKGEFPSYMAEQATLTALKEANIKPDDIDLILMSITMPDYNFPNTSAVLQERLGITTHCPCLDINAACTGWVYGVEMANALIQTGVYKNILMIGCEMTSRFNNWKDRTTCVLFGDGCGATILSRAEDADNSKVLSSHMGCDSSKKDALILYKGSSVAPITKEILEREEQYVTMNGQVVFKAAVKTIAANCQRVLEKAKFSVSDVDWFVPHQANLRIIETAGKLLDFPSEKTVVNVQKYANTSSASIPIALHEAVKDGRIKRGDKILMAAFGAGLTSGALLLEY